MFSIYNLLTSLSLPFFGVAFFTSKRGKVRLKERFGCWNINEKSEVVWFHGASIGEINALKPILEKLKILLPNCKFLLTATNPTVFAEGAKEFDYKFLLPFDSPLTINRAIKNLNLKILLVTETEIWPALINSLAKKRVPIMFINGRISDNTISRYRLLKFAIKPLFKQVAKVLTASKIATKRFVEMGVDSDKVVLVGNSKYDNLKKLSSEEILSLKYKALGNDFPTLVLGCIRPEESDLWLDPIAELWQAAQGDPSKGKFNVFVAPRHSEKFPYFMKEVEARNLPITTWSKLDPNIPPTPNTPKIILVDAYGVLSKVYSLASLSFVGASLTPIGGHNPFEAAVQGSFITMGPYYHTVKQEVADLLENEAITIVNNKEEIKALILEMINNPAKFLSLGKKAQEVCLAHQGATAKIVAEVKSLSELV
jgi:3-deoxy-D-manno-octulosonic-acid transferase